MAIIDVKMLSGFVPVRSSLQKVQEGSDVNKPPKGPQELEDITLGAG